MNTNSELKPGGLRSDLERASRRVQELKIAKSNFSDLVEEEVEENRIEEDQMGEDETLQC